MPRQRNRASRRVARKLQAAWVGQRRSPLAGEQLFHDYRASPSAEDCDFSPQRRKVRRVAQADAPSSLHLCGKSIVLLADVETG
jgi:hypothetical protein